MSNRLKIICWMLLSCIAAVARPAASQSASELPRLVIAPLNAQNGVPEETADEIVQELMVALPAAAQRSNPQPFQVSVLREDLAIILREHELTEAMPRLFSRESAIELGKLVNARYLAYGSVGRTGAVGRVWLFIADMETGDVAATARGQWTDEASQISEIHRIASHLVEGVRGFQTRTRPGTSFQGAGNLILVPRPGPTAVYVDGAYVGVSPDTVLRVEAGVHEIRLLTPYGSMYRDSVHVAAGAWHPYSARGPEIAASATLPLLTRDRIDQGQLLSSGPDRVIVNDALQALQAGSSKIRWFNSDCEYSHRGLLDDSRLITVAGYRDIICIIDLETGSTLWTWGPDDGLQVWRAQLLRAADDIAAVIPSHYGELRILYLESGRDSLSEFWVDIPDDFDDNEVKMMPFGIVSPAYDRNSMYVVDIRSHTLDRLPMPGIEQFVVTPSRIAARLRDGSISLRDIRQKTETRHHAVRAVPTDFLFAADRLIGGCSRHGQYWILDVVSGDSAAGTFGPEVGETVKSCQIDVHGRLFTSTGMRVSVIDAFAGVPIGSVELEDSATTLDIRAGVLAVFQGPHQVRRFGIPAPEWIGWAEAVGADGVVSVRSNRTLEDGDSHLATAALPLFDSGDGFLRVPLVRTADGSYRTGTASPPNFTHGAPIARSGRARIDAADPKLSIWADGIFHRVRSGEIYLSPGIHRISVVSAAGAQDTVVDLRPDEGISFAYIPRPPEPTVLRIETDPPGARVLVDGQPFRGPVTLDRAVGQSTSILVRKPGYRPVATRVIAGPSTPAYSVPLDYDRWMFSTFLSAGYAGSANPPIRGWSLPLFPDAEPVRSDPGKTAVRVDAAADVPLVWRINAVGRATFNNYGDQLTWEAGFSLPLLSRRQGQVLRAGVAWTEMVSVVGYGRVPGTYVSNEAKRFRTYQLFWRPSGSTRLNLRFGRLRSGALKGDSKAPAPSPYMPPPTFPHFPATFNSAEAADSTAYRIAAQGGSIAEFHWQKDLLIQDGWGTWSLQTGVSYHVTTYAPAESGLQEESWQVHAGFGLRTGRVLPIPGASTRGVARPGKAVTR
jgi:hypothetical protein